VTDYTKGRAEKRLTRHVAGFKRLATFAPFLRGEKFSVADAVGFVNLPLVGLTTKSIYGRDFLLEAGIDWKTLCEGGGRTPGGAACDGGSQGLYRGNREAVNGLKSVLRGSAATARMRAPQPHAMAKNAGSFAASRASC
jgi:hypothetical protein